MNLGFFCPRMAVSWRITVFQKLVCWNPYFYSVLGLRDFWAKLSKKGNFWTPPQKRKFWLITEKLFFWYFCVFLVFVFFFFVFLVFVSFFLFFLFVFCFFFGGFKGQVRWPEGPPHLALNPPYLLFVFCCFLLFLLFVLFWFCLFFGKGLRVRWGGPKGNLTWP